MSLVIYLLTFQNWTLLEFACDGNLNFPYGMCLWMVDIHFQLISASYVAIDVLEPLIATLFWIMVNLPDLLQFI